MPDLKPKDKIVYRPLTLSCLYRGEVVAANPDGTVDVELDPEDTGVGEIVKLRRIMVVSRRADLIPGSCMEAGR